MGRLRLNWLVGERKSIGVEGDETDSCDLLINVGVDTEDVPMIMKHNLG